MLIASLALNVFAVGFFSGRVISHDGQPPHAGPGQVGRMDNPFALMHYARDFPPEIRRDFRGEIRNKLPALREQHRKTQMLRQELAALIGAEVWDRDAVTAKFEEIKAAQDLQHDEFGAAFIDALETLPAAERRKLMENSNKRDMRRRRPRDRRIPRQEKPD